MAIKDMLKSRASKRQAKREASRDGLTVDQVAFRDMLSKNADEANKIATEYYKKLAPLGFTIQAWIERNDTGERARMRVWPMSYPEYQEYLKAEQEEKDLTSNPKEDGTTNGEGSGEGDNGVAEV